MKKLFAVALILCLLIPAAVAEAPDVKNMTDAELKALYQSAYEEIIERKLWGETILPAGMYQAGKDLPEGKYECVSRKNNTYVYWYASYEDYLKKDYMKYMTPDEGEAFNISLYGDIVYYIDEECTIRPYVGLKW